MPNILFSAKALIDFMHWAHNDRKILDKIDALLSDIERNGAAKGIGKPEKLKHGRLDGCQTDTGTVFFHNFTASKQNNNSISQ